MIELILFLALVLSYIWLWADAIPSGWIWIGVLGLGFTVGTHLIHGETPRDLGFRLDTIGAAARAAAVPVVPLVAVLLGMGAVNGRLSGEFLGPGRWIHLIGWAFLQQYLLQSFIHRRIASLVRKPLARELTVAAIFAILHLPNPLLVPITFAAGYLFATLFRRAPNIYVLALCHAVGSSAVFFGLDPDALYRMRVGPGFYRI
jgi:membrane protease YdiL (CAAX protease family)